MELMEFNFGVKNKQKKSSLSLYKTSQQAYNIIIDCDFLNICILTYNHIT